jgi:ribosome-binding factor A
MSQRTDRVDELLRQEIGAIIAREVADPRIGFATVTDVETSPDLQHAKVWISVIGDAAQRRETLAVLDGAMGFVRRELGVRLRLRRIPALHVELDSSMEHGTRVLQILDEPQHGDIPRAASLADAPVTETLPTPVPRLPQADDTPDPEAPDGETPPGGPGRGHPAGVRVQRHPRGRPAPGGRRTRRAG